MRIVSLVSVLVFAIAAVAAVLVRESRAQSPRYMAAPDAPGSVWRIHMDTGALEHCSLVKGGCDLVDRND